MCWLILRLLNLGRSWFSSLGWGCRGNRSGVGEGVGEVAFGKVQFQVFAGHLVNVELNTVV